MNKTAKESKGTNRRVNLKEHHESIQREMRDRDAKNRVDKSKTVTYQEKLDELAYQRSVEGLVTSDAPGYRSQYELIEAIKNHEVDVDR